MATVSAIVTAYQFERFIETAVASIQRQTRPPDEIIIVDNQSTDATPDILCRLAAADSRIRLLDVAPHSPARARNRGLRVAGGDFVAILDGDDAWPLDKIATQLARISGAPSIEMVGGLTTFVAEIDGATLTPPAGTRTETALSGHLSAALYRRSLLELLGGFDELFRYADDIDLLLRIRDAATGTAFVDEPMLFHRRYRGSLITTAGDERKTREFARAAGLSVFRRRRLGLPAASSLFDWLRD